MSYGFELCKECKHPYSHHTYTDEKMGCDDCKCTISLGDELGETQIRLHVAEQQLERYRKALEPFAEVYGAIVNEWGHDTFPDSAKFEIEYEHYKRAAAVLKEMQ